MCSVHHCVSNMVFHDALLRICISTSELISSKARQFQSYTSYSLNINNTIYLKWAYAIAY